MREVKTRVLPLPAPARTRTGPWVSVTGFICSEFSEESKSFIFALIKILEFYPHIIPQLCRFDNSLRKTICKGARVKIELIRGAGIAPRAAD